MKQIHIALLSMLIISISSCVNDTYSDSFDKDNKSHIISLNYNIESQLTNRAASTQEDGDYYQELNENIINRVDVFFFNSNNELDWQVDSKSFSTQENKINIQIEPDRSLRYYNNDFTIIVVANAPQDIKNINNLDELKNLIHTYKNLNEENNAPTSFLMDGVLPTGTISWDENNKYEIPSTLNLSRAASKLRLRIKEVSIKEKSVEYKMVGFPEAKLMNYAPTTSIIAGNFYESSDTKLSNTTYRKMNWVKYHDKLNDKTNNSEFIALNTPFYSFQRDWSNAINESPYILVKIELQANNEEPRPYYYSIPINYRTSLPGMNDEQKSDIFKLKRNFLYDIVSSIYVLGSDHEDSPLELKASIGVEPWKEEEISGDLQSAHYLVVKNKQPIMSNITTTQIGYLSDLPIKKLKVEKTWYEYYQMGVHIRVEDTGEEVDTYFDNILVDRYVSRGFEDIKLFNDESNPLKKHIKVESRIPSNYVPLHIKFVVEQEGTSLKEEVVITQYPPKYITGEKSPGLAGGTSEPYADFRFHDSFGAGRQINDVFFKVTTVVNEGNELVGDPTDGYGRTRKDEASNKIISPEFIIASQHGMSPPNTPQYPHSQNNPVLNWGNTAFEDGYGPLSTYYRDPGYGPYYPATNQIWQPVYRNFANADDRCYNYFEGEYGMDGEYEEFLVNRRGERVSRTVYKTFKNKGRWRIPTLAEIELIDAIQDDGNSAVSNLLQGQFYWSAQEGIAYNFTYDIHTSRNQAAIRCIFDTYKLENN